MTIAAQPIVVALGGNAISPPGEQGTIAQQFARVQQTAKLLADGIQAGRRLVITHGNGPQVGNVLRRVELAATEIYPIPLEICVADTQAGMGYMIAQCVMNELAARGELRTATTIVTNVVVDADDPAFSNPQKPIGSPFDEQFANTHQERCNWDVVEVRPGAFRRVVASPAPQEIVEINAIRRLVAADELVVCCGGGGIPVCRTSDGRYQGAEAVIDKDRTSALLASELNAGVFVMLTAVERVCVDFGRPSQRELPEMTVAEARALLADGQFGAGSMRPKIEAAVDFLTRSTQPRPQVVVAHLDRFVDAIEGRSGTRITRDG